MHFPFSRQNAPGDRTPSIVRLSTFVRLIFVTMNSTATPTCALFAWWIEARMIGGACHGGVHVHEKGMGALLAVGKQEARPGGAPAKPENEPSARRAP